MRAFFLCPTIMRWQCQPFREQARSHLWNAFPCRSEPAREDAGLLTKNYLEETR